MAAGARPPEQAGTVGHSLSKGSRDRTDADATRQGEGVSRERDDFDRRYAERRNVAGGMGNDLSDRTVHGRLVVGGSGETLPTPFMGQFPTPADTPPGPPAARPCARHRHPG